MPDSPHTLLTAITEAPSLHWTPCATCWGQRRIWESVEAANGEAGCPRRHRLSSVPRDRRGVAMTSATAHVPADLAALGAVRSHLAAALAGER